MKLDEIHSEWAKDAVMEKEQLDLESLNIPKLHSKYLKMMSNERRVYKALLEKKKTLVSNLTDYYDGKIDGKDIGREPWKFTETKASIEKKVDVDAEVIQMNLKIFDAEEKVLVLKEIISNINNRGFQIKSSIDFLKFINGGN